MTRDTRANLLFLAIFLAISLPGGVILFKKKLDPTAAPMYLPPAPSKVIPYIDPREAPDLKRYIPELTGQWVAAEARSRGLPTVLVRDNLPLTSAQRTFQAVGLDRTDGVTRLHVLLWDVRADTPLVFTLSQANSPSELSPTRSDTLRLPDPVRKELIRSGFAAPPTTVEWVELPLPNSFKTDQPATLTHLPTGDSVPLFTN